MTTILQEKMQKMHSEYVCEKCKFKTSNKYNYDKHLLTIKHGNTTKYNKNTIILHEKMQCDITYECECGKKYPYRASLYNHKKKCRYINKENSKNQNTLSIPNEEPDEIKTPNEISKELILKLVAENSEIKSMLFKQFETMQSQMHEQQKVMQNQISELIPRIGNNTNVINNKNKININIFLNEQCKGAQTIEQFLNDIDVTLDNLAITKNKGLCEGVSNIFIENMNKLSLYERPVHCTDIKRDTLYVKSEENIVNNESSGWEKDEDKKQLKSALKTISHIQRVGLKKWVEKHPNWMEVADLQDEYMTMVRNSTSDLVELNKEDKAIKKICSKIHINEELIESTPKPKPE